MFLLSIGILSARQQHLDLKIACGHWPFDDSRRLTEMANPNATAVAVPIIFGMNSDGTNVLPTTHELYVRIQQAMGVPLLADILTFKTETFAYTFENHDTRANVFIIRAVDWKSNRFLFPAIILSFLSAIVCATLILVFGLREATTTLKKNSKKKEIRKHMKLLKEALKIDSDDDDEENDGKNDEQELQDEEENGDDDDDNVCDDDDDNEQAKREKSRMEKTIKVELNKRILSDSKGVENDLFNEDLSQELLAMIEVNDDMLDHLIEQGNHQDIKGTNKEVIDENNMKSLVQESLQRSSSYRLQTLISNSSTNLFRNAISASSVQHSSNRGCCCYFLGSSNTKVMPNNKDEAERPVPLDAKEQQTVGWCHWMFFEKLPKSLASPFLLPTMWFSEWSSEKNLSLYDFIKSRNTFECDEAIKWTTHGRTSVKRFDGIYSSWCHHNERRKLPVLDSGQLLATLGISIDSELEQSVIGCRFKTKAEIRKKHHRSKSRMRKYVRKAQEIADRCFVNREITALVARFRVGEAAYDYFVQERIVLTDNEVDYLLFDDISQKFSSFYENKRKKMKMLTESNSNNDQNTTQWMVANPMILPLFFARDAANFGPGALSRCDVYMLKNVEVLTKRELRYRQKEQLRLQNRGTAFCNYIRDQGYQFLEAMLFVVWVVSIVLLVPLPLCLLVLYHQKSFHDSTAVTRVSFI